MAFSISSASTVTLCPTQNLPEAEPTPANALNKEALFRKTQVRIRFKQASCPWSWLHYNKTKHTVPGFVINTSECCCLYNQIEREDYILSQVSFLGWGKRCGHVTTSWACPHQNWWSRPCISNLGTWPLF